ncbi:STAS domain-containing protein [Streptomyces althioticus]|uniref:STAS domain-containing protein n=1 Tax=Streptomyces althioticus TaxID=83380 RepID=UPI0036C1B719
MSDALDTTVRYTGKHTAVIVVSGDVDLHTAPLLRVEALTAMTRGARHLVLDMAEVDFVDSTGLSTLIVLLHATQEAGGSLRVARVPERLVRMVTMTGIAELLPLHDTVADALAALDAAEGADDAAREDVSADRGADVSLAARADRDTDVSVAARAGQGVHASATVSADRDTDVSATVRAGRDAQASATVCADRGAGVSVTASADPGADVAASADRGGDGAVGGAGPSR